MNDTFSIAVALGTIVVMLLFIFAIWRKIRNKSGSATMMLGATFELLNEDQQRAAEVIIQKEQQRKMEEQEQGEPEEPVEGPG